MFSFFHRWLFVTIILWVVVPASSVLAQSYTVTGYIEDEASGERISGATVYVPELEIGVASNQYGFYSLTLQAEIAHLVVSHVGYEQVFYALPPRADTTLTFSLTRRIIRLEETEVTAEPGSALNLTQMSVHELLVEEIEKLPVLLGEVDIQKTLQLLPGVQAGVEGSSGLYVRGGRSDQNLFLLDGLPLYNPSHVLGFFSIFNTDAMKRVEFIKGAFPARYGGRLSSVVNFTMKEGNLKKFSGLGAIGLVSSRIMLEGPIIKDRASFLVAGRRTYIEPILRVYELWDNRDHGDPIRRTRAHFSDLNVKANIKVSPRDRIYLGGYFSEDGFYFIERDRPVVSDPDSFRYDLKWQNRMVSLRWNRLFGDRLFTNVTAGIITYRFGTELFSSELNSRFRSSWQSEIVDYRIRADVDWAWTPRHYIRFGAEGVLHHFTPSTSQRSWEGEGIRERSLLQSPTGMLPSRELALYIEDEIQVYPWLKAMAGIRFAMYAAKERSYGSIEPRLSVYARLSERTAAKLSIVRMQQAVHLLSTSGSSLPINLWVPSMNDIPPQRGYQLAAGVVHNVNENRYELTLEGYVKWMSGHIEYAAGTGFHNSAVLEWPDLLETGSGGAYGLEFFAQKKRGWLTGWFGYTWARATRQFGALNEGRSFPDNYDRRHDVSVVAQAKLSAAVHVSGAWIYGSGFPVWAPIGRYSTSGDYSPTELLDFGPVNSARGPSYHRLDLNVQFRKQKSWAERTITLGVYNAYGRKNAVHVYPDTEDTENPGDPISFKTAGSLRLIPAFSWQWRF